MRSLAKIIDILGNSGFGYRKNDSSNTEFGVGHNRDRWMAIFAAAIYLGFVWVDGGERGRNRGGSQCIEPPSHSVMTGSR